MKHVYRIHRNGKVWAEHLNRYLKGTVTKDGYIRVQVDLGAGRKSRLVHRLVALAFIPNPLKKSSVNHIDGNKKNNDVSNLEWVTCAENTAHALATGLMKTGYARHNTRPKEDRDEVFKRLDQGQTRTSIAKDLMVDRKTIYKWEQERATTIPNGSTLK